MSLTQLNNMNNFSANYEKILETLQDFESKMNFLNQIRKPKLSDIELIAIDLTSEYMSIDSEYQLFRSLPDELYCRIERSVYNRRKRKLFPHRELLRKKLAGQISSSDYYIVDSIPLEVCKLSWSTRSRICKEDYQMTPNNGYCASQANNYYGYKLHAVCTIDGVFTDFDLTKVSVHDIHYLKDIKSMYTYCIILGDKGYLSIDYQRDLFSSNQIRLEVPMRKNQKGYKPQAFIFRKSRKRIETLFSQLCDQFMIRRNYAKSFDGFKNRILSKIMALTVIQLINKLNNKNINNLKLGLHKCTTGVGNIFSGQVVGETAKNLSERFGKVLQKRQSMTINRQDTSTSINTQLDSLIPASKISNLTQGMFVGAVSDNFDERIDQKIFHAQIVIDNDAVKAETSNYVPIPQIVIS
ncbi:hypothetical protein M2451_003971 [Dysgonomonas sp. PFB1-18]|nr:hypothetical protein [Dysgonomonas sp. PF1-14]MDH6340967.1 hypothetical protein [Dysgonomonas sp. PF1-16]MDH6382626.1 hypothetical protein [Dysgonomonas sp. PFB1-18]MDH6399973.1 hypothetical protein [Dysgonomonas sp. PF1-23]